MRILIIEDDLDLRTALQACFEKANFVVDCATDGASGSFMGRTTDYDVILLDLCLPKRMGNAVCTELRSAGKTAPIMVMSIMSEIPRKIELLDLGADDYVIKPFSINEVIARVRALTRRPRALQADVLRHGPLTLDVSRQKVIVRGKEVYLTRKEFLLLEYLMRHYGHVVTRSMLLEHVWDGALDTFTNTIETHIRSLRKKLEPKRGGKVIHTLPGRGYICEIR